MDKVTFGQFKRKPTITLGADTQYPFTFGTAKARLILQHLDAIKAFVGQQDKAQTMAQETPTIATITPI